MRALAVALVAALGVILAGPAIDGPAGIVSAHAQLVSSSPGAGDVVPIAPTEIRLVFSEPIEGHYTSLDLLDPVGKTLLLGVGAVDPTDSHVLVVPLSALPNGSYTINWRAVSASDGHSTAGFITFGIGAGSSGGQGTGDATGGGAIHSGHSGPAAIAEVEGKTVGYGGLMLVLGLALLVALFGREVPRAVATAASATWILLIVAASGSVVLLAVGASSIEVPAGAGAQGPDLVGFAVDSRVGQLLLGRTILALAGAAIAFLAATAGRNRLAVGAGAVTAAVGLVLVALGGHAAGFDSPIPILVDVVHLGSASIWLAGVVGLFWLVEFGRLDAGELRAVVPHFSAVALVSVTLIVATGIYQAWIATYDFTSIPDAYSLTLAAKVAMFAIALAFGALNYFDGGRDRRWLGGFRTRIFLEAGFAVAVVGLAANVTSGSPSAEGRPIEIAQAVSTAPPGLVDVQFGVQPGRPGPNRYLVRLDIPPPAGTTVELDLQRLDQSTGVSRVPLRAAPVSTFGPAGTVYLADGGQLGDGSSWDASIVVSDTTGAEIGRRRFTFDVGPDGIAAGMAVPPIDPVIVVGIALVGLGIAGFAFGLAGGRLPRATPLASRLAMVSGGTIGGLLGFVILSGGPR